MALVMVALPRLPRRPLDPVRRWIPPPRTPLTSATSSTFPTTPFMPGLADLPVSHLMRFHTLISEVTSDQFYAIFNMTQLDIETPTGQLHVAGPPPHRGQYPPDHRSNLRGIPDGPRFPDRSGPMPCTALWTPMPFRPSPRRAPLPSRTPRPSRLAPRSSTATRPVMTRSRSSTRMPSSPPAAPPPARGAAPKGGDGYAFSSPRPLVRTDAGPILNSSALKSGTFRPGSLASRPPRPWSISVRGYCTHDCPVRGPRCLRICLRPVMLYSRTEHTGHKCPYCLADGL